MSYRYVTIGELAREARRARRRDWAMGAGAAVGGYLVGKARSRRGPSVAALAVPVLAMPVLLAAWVISVAWPLLLVALVLLVLARASRWHRLRSAPVPWDPGYRAEDDPVPHEREWSQRDDDDGIPF